MDIITILAILGWVAGTVGCAMAIYAKLSAKALLTVREMELKAELRQEMADAMNEVHQTVQSEMYDMLQQVRDEGVIPSSPARRSDPFSSASFQNL